MANKKRILILGASGMIGRAIQDIVKKHPTLELVPASHREKSGYVHVDYETLTNANSWSKILSEYHIDAVVNCVGIWSGTPQEFELVQYTVPIALFDACHSLGLRIVHLSALGFSVDSSLPYASTKARADRYLLDHFPNGVVVYPSLVFGNDGDSSKFFLNLAALPVQVDFGFERNLQPVHVCEVANAVGEALIQEKPERAIVCAGTHHVTTQEYFAALRIGMGLKPAPLTISLPLWCSKILFQTGELLRAHFVNNQTWVLLQTGTHSNKENFTAMAYAKFATPNDLQMVRETQLYWFARLGIAFLWLWTAVVTMWVWPQAQTLSWLDSLFKGLGTVPWLAASCVLDATMGVASLIWPRTKLWLAQFSLTTIYSLGLAFALPWSWAHPFGPLTKNIAVLATMLYLAMIESKRGR